MPKDVLVIAEHRGGKIKKVTTEAIGAAQSLAEALRSSVHIAVLGSGVEDLADELSRYGRQVFLLEDPKLEFYSNDGYAQALAPFIRSRDYSIMLLGATPTGRDLSAMLAARLEVSLAPDCTALQIENGKLAVTRPVFAGKAIAKVAINTTPAIATIRPNTFPVAENSDGGTVERIPCTVGDLRVVIKEVVQKAAGRMELTEADIVVSGGRGLKEPGNYRLIEELAEAIGGATGASRAIVDAEWVDHSMQVGQTGKTVSPKLYIAIGISGAIQHLAGMSSSKVIVAINNNPDAPIFKVADYGIVADAMDAVPLMIEEFRKLAVH